jgi:hypothetical protein
MTEPRDEPPAGDYDGVRDYTLVCATGLVVMLLALLQMRLGIWSFLPVVLGAMALLLRWRTGAFMVLIGLGLLLGARSRGFDPGALVSRTVDLVASWFMQVRSLPLGVYPRLPLRPPSLLAELLLALGTLAFCAGYFRLHSLQVRLFPPVARRERSEQALKGPYRRPAEQVTLTEVVGLLVVVGAFVVLGQWAWQKLEVQTTDFNIDDRWWQAMLLVALGGGGALLGAGLLRHLAWRRLSGEEARLYLQDVAWGETRGEQRRLNRWLAWAWLKRRRSEGQ